MRSSLAASLFVISLAVLAAPAANAAQSASAQAAVDREHVQQFIKSFVKTLDLPDDWHRTPRHKLVDLNNDGRTDIIILAEGPGLCGSLGCAMHVYMSEPDGQFKKVYEKQSPDERFPTIGPGAKQGHKTLYFPHHRIGDGRVLYEIVEWEDNAYFLNGYRDGKITIMPVDQREEKTLTIVGGLRDRPSRKARMHDKSGSREAFKTSSREILGTVENKEGKWVVFHQCNGCAYGYAKIRP